MPTFLPPDRWNDWLQIGNRAATELIDLLDIPEPAADLQAIPVSTKVNNARNAGSELIKPIEIGEPETLF